MPDYQDSCAEEVAFASASYQYTIPRIQQRFCAQRRSVPKRMRGRDAVAAAKPQKIGVSCVLICFCDLPGGQAPTSASFCSGVEVV